VPDPPQLAFNALRRLLDPGARVEAGAVRGLLGLTPCMTLAILGLYRVLVPSSEGRGRVTTTERAGERLHRMSASSGGMVSVRCVALRFELAECITCRRLPCAPT
jgi:hypothetical protein